MRPRWARLGGRITNAKLPLATSPNCLVLYIGQVSNGTGHLPTTWYVCSVECLALEGDL